MPSRIRALAALAAILLIPVAGAPSGGAEKLPTDSERLKALSPEEREWLTDYVAPIILPEERKVFLELTAPYQREEFVEDFWQRREQNSLPPPLGPGYRHRYRDLRRLADEVYDGWRTDAGGLVVRHGEPVSVWKPKGCAWEIFRDLEVWTYNPQGAGGTEGAAIVHGQRRYVFYRLQEAMPRRLWNVGSREDDIFLPGSCRKKISDLRLDCVPNSVDPCRWPCLDRCELLRIFEEIQARQGSDAGAAIDEAFTYRPPPVSTEGLERQRAKWASTSDPKAKPIHIEAPPAKEVPEPRHFLSHDEIVERILLLGKEDRAWLESAGPLMTMAELSDFLQFTRAERDAFMRRFFKRRS
jgi:GWxTD domain-containing protein